MATAESRFSCPVEDTLELFCEKKQNRNFCVKEMEGVAKKLFFVLHKFGWQHVELSSSLGGRGYYFLLRYTISTHESNSTVIEAELSYKNQKILYIIVASAVIPMFGFIQRRFTNRTKIVVLLWGICYDKKKEFR